MEDYIVNLTDPASERAINAGLCQYGRVLYDEVCELINPSSFVIDTNQIIFRCLADIYESNPEDNLRVDESLLLSSAHKLNYSKFFEDSNEKKILRSMFSLAIEKDTIKKLAAKVKKLELRRKLLKQLKIIEKQVEEAEPTAPIEEIINKAETDLLDFTNNIGGVASDIVPFSKNIFDYLDYVMNNETGAIGISSGFSKYDHYIGGGFRRGTINLIGAPKKTGKSFMSLTIGMHVAGQLNVPVLYLDTEMGLADHYPRALAQLTGLSISHIENGNFRDKKMQRKQLKAAVDKLNSMPFHYVNISGKPFEEIFSIIRRFITKTVGKDENGVTNNCLVIYDYLKLMSAESINNNMAEYQALGFLTSNLHNFAVHYQIPVLAFSQLNRQGDIAASDRITWLCTSITYFKPKTEEELADGGEKYGNRILIPLLARHGPGIDDGNYINFIFNKNTGMITEGLTLQEVKQAEKTNDPPEEL